MVQNWVEMGLYWMVHLEIKIFSVDLWGGGGGGGQNGEKKLILNISCAKFWEYFNSLWCVWNKNQIKAIWSELFI
jgi:hypothetical protein